MAEKDRTRYEDPLGIRYGKGDMSRIFSDDYKFKGWRRCWIALAEAEQELGLAGITKKQVDQLKKFADNINYEVAEVREREIRHDVMSHVYAFGQQCPEAAGIIHAGATSCDITDNVELMQIHDGSVIIEKKLVNTINLLTRFSRQYRELPVLGFTHYQPAQPTTLGKRACMWLQDIVLDYDVINEITQSRPLRGLKGTTGTQASFLELAEGNHDKVETLNKKFLEKLGYNIDFPITGQTYTRKYDSLVLGILSGIAESAHKFGIDLRLMQNRKEMEEPFEKGQVGSSAMAYKRNPMRAERMCSLAREVVGNETKARMTAMFQLHERTLDDSAGRRLYIPQSFLATDEVLNLYMNIMESPVVYPKVIEKNLRAEMPFMATENILMEAVKRGKSRQEVHEAIRVNSQEVGRRIKEEGADNDLLERLSIDKSIGLTLEEIKAIVDVRKFIGRAPQQVDKFLKENVDYILQRAEKDGLLGVKSDVRV